MFKSVLSFWVLCIFVFVFAGCDGCSIEEGQKKREAVKVEQLRQLTEVSVPVRFKVLERKDGRIKAEFQFYSVVMDNINDMEYRIEQNASLNSRVLELEGNELFIDFLKYEEEAGIFSHPVYWAFPYRVFTDRIAPDNGVQIYQDYDRGGFPSVYNAFNLDSTARQNLSNHFLEIKQYGNLEDSDLRKKISGNAMHDMQKVAQFRVDRWYDIAVHIRKGTIEFVAE
jgi:hypothetical protein